MIPSAPLLAPSQPTKQPPGSAGLTPGSDSTFGAIFSQTIVSRLQSDEKAQTTPSSPTPQENAAADKNQPEQHDTWATSTQGTPPQNTINTAVDQQAAESELPVLPQPENLVSRQDTLPAISLSGENGLTARGPADIFNASPTFTTDVSIPGQSAESVPAATLPGHGISAVPVITAQPGPDAAAIRTTNGLNPAQPAHQDLAIARPPAPPALTAGTSANSGDNAPPATDATPLRSPDNPHSTGTSDLFPRADQEIPTSGEAPILTKGQSGGSTAPDSLQNPAGSAPVTTAPVTAADYRPVPATTLPGTAIGTQQMDAVITLSDASTGPRVQPIAGGSSAPAQAAGNLPVASGADASPPLPGETAAVRMPGFTHLAALADSASLATTSGTSAVSYGGTSLSAYDSGPLMVSLHQLTNLKTTAADSRESAQSAPVQPLRQQFREQLLAGKMESANSDGRNQNSPQQEVASSPQFLAPQSLTNQAGEQSFTFSQVSQGVLQQGTPQAAPATPQPVPVSPQPPPLHDDTVFNQVSERFLLQMRNQETRLNIQLHPAELGKLDINLTVKEGAIRAHVVAQSGQVQEILERNMNRLRGILEGQGFSIEEILVSIRSESIDNPDLFGEQFARQQTPDDTSSQNSDTDFRETLESVVATTSSPTTRVNITA